MKITILTRTHGWGGTEAHAAGLARLLADRGHRVVLVCLGHDVFRRCLGGDCETFRIVEVPTPTPVEDMGVMECVELLENLEGDVCVLPKGDIDVGSWKLDLAARRRFGRLVTIEQLCAEPMPPRTSRRYLGGLLPGLGLWWYQQRMERWLRGVIPNRVVCVSGAVRRRLVGEYGFSPRKLLTICNGIDPQKFHCDPAHRTAARSAWGVPEGAMVFGAVGRLARVKGYDLAIAAFAELLRENPQSNAYLVLTGSGPEEGELKAAAGASGWGNRIIFPGFADRPWEAYPGLDVFLLPSLNEGLPLALAEAMACQCVPIAMDVSGVGDLIQDASMGWLIPAGDRAGWVEAMREAMGSDRERLEAMGRRARSHVVENFDSAKQLKAVAEVIESTHGKLHRGKEPGWEDRIHERRRPDCAVPQLRKVSEPLRPEHP